jgi:hypothetical protein
MGVWAGWEASLLAAIGAPVTSTNVQFLDAWQNAEGGQAENNPLNTTHQATGATAYNTFNANGVTYHVWNYPDASTGLAATAQTLSGYSNIVAALQSGNPYTYGNQAGLASDLGTWGTGSAFLGSSSAATPAGAATGAPYSTAPAPISRANVLAIGLIVGIFLLIVALAGRSGLTPKNAS